MDYDTSNMVSLGLRYETYICGSDQIWNPFSLDNPNVSFFYAAFTGRRKIAYAPSLGISAVPAKYTAKLKSLISTFDWLSAREPQGVAALAELSDKSVEFVVDPTLLIRTEQWDSLLPLPLQLNLAGDKKYVLAYFLTYNSLYVTAAVSYAKSRNCQLKIFFTDSALYGYDCELLTAGPIEFLQYVKQAECLLTDSFHGSIFACIFHTQFIVFKRFGDTERSQDSRVENLLNLMGLSERFLDEGSCGKLCDFPDIDFTKVDTNIAPYIEQSKNYLIEALNGNG